MMDTILYLYEQAKTVVAKGIPVSQAVATGLFEDVIKMKYTIGNDDLAPFDALQKEIKEKNQHGIKRKRFFNWTFGSWWIWHSGIYWTKSK